MVRIVKDDRMCEMGPDYVQSGPTLGLGSPPPTSHKF